MASVTIEHDGILLHALDNAREGTLVPVVVVPGMGEEAAEYAWLLDGLGDRRVVIVDVRGRGESDAPPSGYRWEDHYGDVLAVMDALTIDRPVMTGYSRGASYALGAALHSPRGIRGLVMNDYNARHVGLPPAAADGMLQQRVRGRTNAERMPEHAVRGVVTEGLEIPLWDRLRELDCPVLVLRGGRKGSLLDDDAIERYRAALPGVQTGILPARAHDLWSKDIPAYLSLLTPFLVAIDAEATAVRELEMEP